MNEIIEMFGMGDTQKMDSIQLAPAYDCLFLLHDICGDEIPQLCYKFRHTIFLMHITQVDIIK